MANVGGEGLLSGAVGRFRMLKLHGSISWYVFSAFTGPVSPVYDADFCRGWAMGQDTEAELLRRVSGRSPLIVPPVLGKDPYLNLPELRAQWLQAEMALRLAERVFVLGCQLPPTDLPMRFLLDRSPDDCTIIPVNTRADVANRMVSELKPRPINHDYSGTATAIRDFVADYVASGPQIRE
jgi:hypothetical protein